MSSSIAPSLASSAASTSAARARRPGSPSPCRSETSARSPAVELVAKSSTKGARIVFAEPRVVAARADAAREGAACRAASSWWCSARSPRRRSRLTVEPSPCPSSRSSRRRARSSKRIARRRASRAARSPRCSPACPPRAHGVSEPEAMLGTTRHHHRGGGAAGAASSPRCSRPTRPRRAPYGFARGWETFVAHSPIEEGPATTVFEDVERWLDGHKDNRFLVVVHARGGHPPWDTTPDEKDLPPVGYTGSLDAKHAGEMLAKVRKQPSSKLFTDADRERAFALHAKRCSAHDAALGRLVAHVRSNRARRRHDLDRHGRRRRRSARRMRRSSRRRRSTRACSPFRSWCARLALRYARA